MYSRQNAPRGQSAPWQIPRNYSGNAFSHPEPDENSSDLEATETSDEGKKSENAAAPASVDCNSESKKAGLFGLSRKGGIGFEELLILGLVLLVSQSDEGEGNNDLAFLLLLLLFIQ